MHKCAFRALLNLEGGKHERSRCHYLIDQLLGYLTRRDYKTALIVFNKNNKDFSKILETIVPSVEAHLNFVFNDGQIDENEWHFTMQSVGDESRQV